MKVLSGMYGQRIVSDLGWTLPEMSEVPRFSSTSHTLLFSSPSTWGVVFQSRDTQLCLCSGPRCGFSLRIWYITDIAAEAFCLLVCFFSPKHITKNAGSGLYSSPISLEQFLVSYCSFAFQT